MNEKKKKTKKREVLHSRKPQKPDEASCLVFSFVRVSMKNKSHEGAAFEHCCISSVFC
jgi:hypothetical protein